MATACHPPLPHPCALPFVAATGHRGSSKEPTVVILALVPALYTVASDISRYILTRGIALQARRASTTFTTTARTSGSSLQSERLQTRLPGETLSIPFSPLDIELILPKHRCLARRPCMALRHPSSLHGAEQYACALELTLHPHDSGQ